MFRRQEGLTQCSLICTRRALMDAPDWISQSASDSTRWTRSWEEAFVPETCSCWAEPLVPVRQPLPCKLVAIWRLAARRPASTSATSTTKISWPPVLLHSKERGRDRGLVASDPAPTIRRPEV